ncbi:MAG TPA: hypothetical protein VFF68_07920, partial [Anaerolineaceae bacterium]|nr:hypothetical protein [Anaerolineaceae bacterium]
ALKAERSDYSGKLFGNLHWLVNAATLATVQLPELEGMNARLLYGLDGLIYRAATLEDSGGYRVVFELIDPAVRKVVRLNSELTSDDFLWVSAWAAH